MITPFENLPPAAGILDLELIRKYSVPGPRYTSYPAATRFTADLATLYLEEAVADDNRPAAADGASGQPSPVSLYFHLPFCETRCWFCGCTTVITRRSDVAGKYLDSLGCEVRLMAERMDRRRPVAQVHFGGGTPTFLAPDELRRLGALIHDTFRLAPDTEFSVEIDPRRLTRDHVAALKEIGANRASLGIQDTDPRVQLAIHRLQPQSLNEQAFDWLREDGFRSLNVDLIDGLPLQTPATFTRTIDRVLGLGPDRLSVFSYAHVPWIKPAQRILEDRQPLPRPEEKLAMFATAHEQLTAAGFVDIGLDHFARPDDALAVAQRNGTLHRNFQGYSTHAGSSLYGFGLSSISATATTYRQNHKTLAAWQAALAAGQWPVERGLRLSTGDQRRRTIIMRIMCDRRIDFAALSRAIGVDFSSCYASEIDRLAGLETDGLLQRTPAGFEVTRAGSPLLRIIALQFDAYYSGASGRHAQAI